MIKHLISITPIISMVILLSGCANTTVMPHGNDTYSVISTSSDEGYATKAAMEKATTVCQKEKKEVAVIKSSTKYQGAPKDQKALIDLADRITETVVSHGHSTSMGSSSSSSNDYKVTIKFRCT